ncbi:CASP-like protein 1C1 [Castanea sativa]|uniref:CASP-like protein 1C1 n=1 Tax=Castanea sativa TaxID=21020 RepID=UPI003F64DA0B
MAAKNPWTCVLRITGCVATLLAALALATARESVHFSNVNVSIQVGYSDLMCYMYFLVVNVIACVYSFANNLLPEKSLLWRLVGVIDAMLMVLLASSNLAALSAICLERNGNFHAGWKGICGLAPQYCIRIIGAITASFLGFVIYMMLLLLDINNLLNPNSNMLLT